MAVQDAHVYVSENDAGTRHEVYLRPSRQAYLVRRCLAAHIALLCVGESLTVISLQLYMCMCNGGD